MSAKVFLALFLCAAVNCSTLPEGIKSLIMHPRTPDAIKLCNREYKLDDYIQGTMVDVALFKIPAHACFIKCLFEHLDLWTPDGQPNKKAIKEVFNLSYQEKKIFTFIDLCIKKVKTEKDCQRIFEVKECVEDLVKGNVFAF